MKAKSFFLCIMSIVIKINVLLATPSILFIDKPSSITNCSDTKYASPSTPSISNVVTSPINDVGIYGKFEITFTMNNYSNPYNPDIVNSYGEFWSPSGKYYKVFAFYYQDYTKTDSICVPYQCEKLTPNGINSWKIRFTPNEVGNWQYRITASQNSVYITYPIANTLSFTCIPSLNKGFIEKANNKFLKRTTGEFFFPVGQNVAWYNYPQGQPQGPATFGTNEIKYYIDNMALNNSDFIRVWLDFYDGMALVGYDYATKQIYFDLYNQKDAYQLDWIFDYAKTKGINIMLCLFTSTSWNDGDSLGWNDNWTDRNPFNLNNGGSLSTPFQFFTDSTAISKTKNLLKYIVSRWGFSTNLVAWELWNEFNEMEKSDPTNIPPTFYSDILSWHNVMYDYIRSLDQPHKHLITTSYSGDSTSSDVFSIMDFTQSHDYKRPDIKISDDFQHHFYTTAQNAIETASKPYFCGEWGFGLPQPWLETDPKGVELHCSLWSSAFSTALGAVSNWWWDSYIKPLNLFSRFKPVSVFMNSIPVPSQQFFSYNLPESNGLRTYYMKNSNNDTIYGWTQDINFKFQKLRETITGRLYLNTLYPHYKPYPSSTINHIDIPVDQNNRHYIVKWYSAETGLEFKTDAAISNNNRIVIYIPNSLRNSTFGDAVFAIYLDCDKYIWREGPLSNNTYLNVSGNVVCNKITGQVFYRTYDNKINSMWWDSSSNTWQWSALDNKAYNVAGDLAITQGGNQVFYRTTNNKINSIWWDSNTESWEWSELDQAANWNVRGPIAVSSNDQVFYRTLDYKLNNIYRDSSTGTWHWSELDNAASGNVGDAIAISSDVQVFYKTLNNKLNRISWDSSIQSWRWSDLNNAANGNVCGNITVTPNKQVFYRTCNNKLNNIWMNSSTGLWNWSGLDNSANNVAGDLMADHVGKVFYRNTNNNINCIYWSNGSWYWSSLNNSTSSNVNSGNIATDNLGNVFFRGSDNRIHRLYYKPQCDYTPSTNFQKQVLLSSIYNENTNDNKYVADAELDVLLYPSPTSNMISVVSKESFEQLYIYNVGGKLLEVIAHINANEIDIDISRYNNGVYFIKCYFANGKLINRKFIVKN